MVGVFVGAPFVVDDNRFEINEVIAGQRRCANAHRRRLVVGVGNVGRVGGEKTRFGFLLVVDMEVNVVGVVVELHRQAVVVVTLGFVVGRGVLAEHEAVNDVTFARVGAGVADVVGLDLNVGAPRLAVFPASVVAVAQQVAIFVVAAVEGAEGKGDDAVAVNVLALVGNGSEAAFGLHVFVEIERLGCFGMFGSQAVGIGRALGQVAEAVAVEAIDGVAAGNARPLTV